MTCTVEAATTAGSELDLSRYIHAGDVVTWGQACGEPLTLTALLMKQRGSLGPIRCFVGIPASETLRPEYMDHMEFISYCGTGSNRGLARAGVLEIYPGHYSAMPWELSRGALAVDVVLVQLSPPDEHGRYSLGLSDDFLSTVIPQARVVIAEVNEQVPQTPGTNQLTDADLDVVIRTSRPPAEQPASRPSEAVLQVAARVAALIPDGATIQFGLGALPETVLGLLGDKNDLGIHSGMISDAAAQLMQQGVVTNARKSLDPGCTVAGLLIGTRKLFDFAHQNPGIRLAGTSYTHAPEVLAAQRNLVAINSAIEVDLTGQINAETAGGLYVGAVGGGADFLRGAARSEGGLPIVALPSTAGGASRIVSSLSGPVSTSRADAGLIVTEFGVADLRGRTLSERRELMLSLAHPDHRNALASIAGDSSRPRAYAGIHQHERGTS
ncbi:acetyl-CoA hydrolase/transferase family protein [bacterium RCC_150]